MIRQRLKFYEMELYGKLTELHKMADLSKSIDSQLSLLLVIL